MLNNKFHGLAVGGILSLFIVLAGAAENPSKPTTREMNLITWQEFHSFVPDKIETVLLPVGSIEPHGVIPNGTDNLAPQAMSHALAADLNALIAPTLNYGITETMAAYPGAVSVKPDSYLPFIRDILQGLASNKFKNIIILNGHGGNTAALKEAATAVSHASRVRILVVNWWSLASEDTLAVFGEDGGHAGNNETAYMQAVVPEHIHPEQYDSEMAVVNPVGNSWFAAPVAASILLYQKGQGYPTFDAGQARDYFERVNDRVKKLVKDVIRKWDAAGLFR
jgi:creatinine amidohydrolase